MSKRHKEINYWISYSDLMAGLLFIFLAIIFIANKQYKEEKEKLKKSNEEFQVIKNELEDFLKLKNSISIMLRDTIDDPRVRIDPITGDLELPNSILFDFDKNVLKPEGKAVLRKIMPLYLSILMNNNITKSKIDKVQIIGHASKFRDTKYKYLYNMVLSQERAFAVSSFILETNKSHYTNLKTYMVSLGRSYSDAEIDMKKYPKFEDWKAVSKNDQKVVIKYKLKSEEMLHSIARDMDKL